MVRRNIEPRHLFRFQITVGTLYQYPNERGINQREAYRYHLQKRRIRIWKKRPYSPPARVPALHSD